MVDAPHARRNIERRFCLFIHESKSQFVAIQPIIGDESLNGRLLAMAKRKSSSGVARETSRNGKSGKFVAAKKAHASSGKTVVRSAPTGRFVGGYEVLGNTKDGVRILKPKGKPKSFTVKKLKEAIGSTRAD